MLDYSAIQLPTEHRYKSFAMNTRTVQKILMKATIERHFTTIESLDKSTVFDKVWKEVNALSKKVCGGPLEQVIIQPVVFKKLLDVIFCLVCWICAGCSKMAYPFPPFRNSIASPTFSVSFTTTQEDPSSFRSSLG